MNHVSAGGEGRAAVSMAPAAGTSCTVPRDQRPMPGARDVVSVWVNSRPYTRRRAQLARL